MGTDRATLRIRRGEQTHGPMSLQKVEELLAKGRLQETDLVSDDDGPWLPLKVWQGQKSRRTADEPLFDDGPLFSGPVTFDPGYVPLSDPDVTARGDSSGMVPVAIPEPGSTPSLQGSGELKPDEEPRPRRLAAKAAPANSPPSSDAVKPQPSSGAVKTQPSSGTSKTRPSSASIPAARPVDEAGMDALLQSLADDARKAPTVTPPRRLPPPRRL
jgi:hypothetical protein